MNTAFQMLKAAAEAGYSFVVYYDDPNDPDYQGDSHAKAWEACKDCVDPMNVSLRKAGARSEWALIIAHDVDDDETLADFSTNGWIDGWWEAQNA